MYSQSIDIDIRAPEDTNPPDEEFLGKSTQKMCQFKTDGPVILPLFKKLYCTPEAEKDLHDEPAETSGNKPETGIMHTKLQEVLRNDPNISTEDVLRFLSFNDAEREHVERTTSKQ